MSADYTRYAHDAPAARQRRARVLAVDDNADVTDYLSARLEPECEVIAVNDPAGALAAARVARPDLILIDVEMPGVDGFTLCRRMKDDPSLEGIPIIFLTVHSGAELEKKGLEAGAVDYIHKRSDRSVFVARVRAHIALRRQSLHLEDVVAARTAELEASREALRAAVHNLRTTRVCPGVYWVQVPEAGIYILCGSPPDVVKHLMLRGYIAEERLGSVICETGPNVILLSETLLNDGSFANMAEFPVLQMLYRQGTLLPGHPNNTGARPMLIGVESQVRAQLDYIYRGNYGLASHDELVTAGAAPEQARGFMALKLAFAFGRIRASEELLDSRAIGNAAVELARGVTARRTGFNRYEFSFQGHTTEVDLNLAPGERYEAPYSLGHHPVEPHYFAVVHIGEGDGWDVRRQCMGSLIVFQGRYYLVDAGPNIGDTLRSLGIDPGEIEGVFQTHAHDDHFAGLPTLLCAGRRVKFFATTLVRHSVAKKLCAIMAIEEPLFEEFFEIHDLHAGLWNDCDGLDVMPLDSPHPVETTAFVFRSRDDGAEKTYAHLADIVSRETLARMLSDPAVSAALPADYLQKIFAGYLAPASVKKIDGGGGLIHGDPLDFATDTSEKIVLAHRATPYTPAESQVGSEAVFGAVEVLIRTEQDYIRQRAYMLLRDMFPDAEMSRMHALLRSPVVSLNAGSLILSDVRHPPFVYLILTGTASRTMREDGAPRMLSAGSLIGMDALFPDLARGGSWRAASSVRLLRIGIETLRSFLVGGGWHESLRSRLVDSSFLADTWLLGERLDFHTLSRVSQLARRTELADGEALAGSGHLQLVLHGGLERRDAEDRTLENVPSGGFVGEEACLGREPTAARCVARGATTLLGIPGHVARSLPIVLWKLLQTHERRLRGASAPG